MMSRYQDHHAIFVLLLLTVVSASSCSNSKPAMVEAPPSYQPTPSSPQIKLPSVIAPKLPEVQEAVHRVFKDSAVIDSAANPNFLTGDFNGDQSEDLAVVLKPVAGKLAEMNEEYPSWLLRDPFQSDPAKRPKLTIQENEVLLAIIHGFGENDWRDPQATQTFLLKNVTGSNMAVLTGKDFSSKHSGRQLPRPSGDLIEETLGGTNGCLYYASANYLWYDPKTFNPKPDLGMVHGGR
jgi:hypothetical protein